MEASRVKQLLEGLEAIHRQEDGRRIYVIPKEEWRVKGGGYRLLHIGSPNDRPTRCVLLLGETGAGKTTIVNAALNCLFGVEFDDPFRLQVREETEDGRRATESQTDAVTVYIIHHQAGMRHEYNCVLIDTPGLADTRGTQRQEAVRSGLETFLTSEDAVVDELHCVGIVAKASVNRDLHSHKQMIGEMISLFGNSVPDVTCVLATFATDTPTVDTVMRNAGIRFTGMFPYDNGVLYTPQGSTATSDHAEFFPGRWKIMMKHHDAFFKYLTTAPPIRSEILRERKLFDINKKELTTQIIEAATFLAAYYTDKNIYSTYELQEAKNSNYMEQVTKLLISLENPAEDLCAHNCRKCLKTCHECNESVEEKAVLDALCDAIVEDAGVKHGLILAEPKDVTESVAVLVFTAAAKTGGSEAARKAAAGTGGSLASSEARGGSTGGSKNVTVETIITDALKSLNTEDIITKINSNKLLSTGLMAASATNLGTLLAAPEAAAANRGVVAAASETVKGARNLVAPEAAAANRGVVAAASKTVKGASNLVAPEAAAATMGVAAAASETVKGASNLVASEAAAATRGVVAAAVTIPAAAASLSLAVGVAVGVGISAAGYYAYKNLKNSCDMDAKAGCKREDCRHSLSDHCRQDKVITKEIKDDQRTNKEKKERYDKAVAGKREAHERISRGKQDILTKMTMVSKTTTELLYHAKRTQELTSKKRDYITEVMNHIISGSLQAGEDVTAFTVKLSSVLQQAMERLASCTAQQARGSSTLVEEMFLSMFRDQ